MEEREVKAIYSTECHNCGKRYSESKPECKFCGAENMDYVKKALRIPGFQKGVV